MEQVIEPTLANRLNDLRAQITGSAYLPGDEGFAEAQAGWNLLVQHQPAVVITAKTESDVQAAIRFANEFNLPIAVQATGHGQFKTCIGGLLLNISQLTDVQVDPQTKSAKIGGGTQWARVIEATQPYNLIPISGSSPTVGVVGYTVGGGYGILSRKYGLGVDQVISFRLVDPNGDIKTVSSEDNADLFWAILGGGASFGVITQVELQLHDQPPILGGSVMFDATLASTIYPAYLEFTKNAPEEVTSALSMMTFPPVPFVPEFLHGRSMLIFCATAIGDLPEAEALLAPIRNLAGAEFDSFRPMPYSESHAVFSDPVDPMPATCRGVLLKDLEQEDIAKILESVGAPQTSENLLVRIRHYDGAITRVNDTKTSMREKRQGKYILYFLGVPMGPVTLEMMQAQTERVFRAVESQILSHGPLNWLGEGNVGASCIQSHFAPADYERQKQVKAAIDPHNRFSHAGIGLA